MKNLFYVVLILITTTCKSQNYNQNLKKIKMKMNQIDNKNKKIDSSIFTSYIDKTNKKDNNGLPISKMKNGNVIYINKENDTYTIDEYDSKKEKVKQTKVKSDNQIEVIEKIDNNFNYYETYYGNGNIKSKQIIAPKMGFGVGIIYKYNDKGKLVETIDTDDGYKFTFENVFEFCKTKKMDFNSSSFPLRIMKMIRPDRKKTWLIEYPNEEKRKIETYILDALTGNVLEKKEIEWPVFEHNVGSE